MDRHRVKPGDTVELADWDASDTSAFSGVRQQADAIVMGKSQELDVLQELLYAGHKHRLLIVLQGMDTSGKDATIRHVFHYVDPLGVRVSSFKVPSQEEGSFDFLWRIHKQVPAKGEIVIFNRSHYEDVCITRVRDLVPRHTWQRRYAQINDFERMLAEEGTTILKFYLHIDRHEQKQRLEARRDDPDKRWKFSRADVEERLLWPKYMEAYEEAISKTSTEWAPWYIVPANHKWYRNLVVASVIVDSLSEMRMEYPKPAEGLAGIEIS
ncbi:MAG TPA: polyphosphate kinase 2 family protein [Dehalococcoidia bacterium]|nr:polyphosphate kinase 2 family protein [Dehalococcoidia bacterium]